MGLQLREWIVSVLAYVEKRNRLGPCCYFERELVEELDHAEVWSITRTCEVHRECITRVTIARAVDDPRRARQRIRTRSDWNWGGP